MRLKTGVLQREPNGNQLPISHVLRQSTSTGPVLQALRQLIDLSKGRVLFEVKKARFCEEVCGGFNAGHVGGFQKLCNYFYDILVTDFNNI